MKKAENDIDTRLSELAKATHPICARADFTERVMNAIHSEWVWRDELLRSSRRLLPVAVLATLLSVAWGKTSADSANEVLAVSDEVVELEW